MRSFDDLLDRLASGWVIRCGEGRPARDKVNRGETLFGGRVCSGDLADTEVTVLLVQPRRGLCADSVMLSGGRGNGTQSSAWRTCISGRYPGSSPT